MNKISPGRRVSSGLRRLPPFTRLMIVHGAIGFAISALLIAVILWKDPFGLATLLDRAEGAPGPLLLLWFFCGLTFGSVQIGAAIMLMEDVGQEQVTEFYDRENRRR